MLHVVTFATDSSRLKYLKETAKLKNLEIHYIMKDKWNGFFDKILYTREFLSRIDDNDIVCFIDAYDVILLRDISTFEDDFLSFCKITGKKVIALSLPLRQRTNEYQRALNHISFLTENYNNVLSHDIDLTDTFNLLEKTLPHYVIENKLAMANTRSRLRMSTLYAVGQANNLLVTGTGNKIEDFGVGFFTKYG